MNSLPYKSPEIALVKLDSEISLILESTPPAGPEEGISENMLSIVQHVNKII